MKIQALEKAIENLEYKVAKLEFEVYEQRRTIGQLIMEKADRKTENSSEKPNNSTCSKMEQVDKDINVRSKGEPQTCSVNGRPYTDCCNCEHFRCTADEPQTERPCDNCQEFDCYGCEYKQTER